MHKQTDTHRHKGKKILTAANLHNAQGYTLSLLLPLPFPLCALPAFGVLEYILYVPYYWPAAAHDASASQTIAVKVSHDSSQLTHTPRVTHTHIALGDTLAEQSLMPTIETGRG